MQGYLIDINGYFLREVTLTKGESVPARVVTIAPMQATGELTPRWMGNGWQLASKTQAQPAPEPTPKPQPAPNTKLHKAWFKERLIPFAEDIKAARQADATVDLYFSILDEYKVVDVTWHKTIAMLQDAEARVKAVVPESTISAAGLLLPQQPNEVFYEV
ncbi:hypothetical protein [Bowmanella denitrificans]|uniref:hypothetical protein n=1 Tax=Bowmanella denitrificans TaxID=366582 RepID=UPI000C9C123D|nr:hypothetical protein [Bowmanella denitrificans]